MTAHACTPVRALPTRRMLRVVCTSCTVAQACTVRGIAEAHTVYDREEGTVAAARGVVITTVAELPMVQHDFLMSRKCPLHGPFLGWQEVRWHGCPGGPKPSGSVAPLLRCPREALRRSRTALLAHVRHDTVNKLSVDFWTIHTKNGTARSSSKQQWAC